MVQCPACGKENEDAAWECKRCRAPLREGEPPAQDEGSLGTVCRRCEAYNEPGVRVCTACGLELFSAPPPTPPAPAPPPAGAPALTMTSELRALSLSDEEAAEAGLGVLPAKTPPPPARRPPPDFSPEPADPAPAAEKACASCGAANPPAAKFCFECGTPFGKKPDRASAPPTIQVDDAATVLQVPISLDDGAEGASAEGWPPPDEAVPAESVAEPLPDDAPQEREWLPFQANLVVEKGNAPGTTFPLAHRENPIGAEGAAIALSEDAFIGPLSATLVFVEERLLVRDEGAANGVFVKMRAPAPLEAGDHFIAGERLFRFEGSIALPAPADTPVLGAPRPAGAAIRVVEVLAGGRTGRTCHRGGPSMTIGRTGCDMNFPGDALLAPRHAEIRIADDGAATLADLGQGPSGVLLRVRRQGEHEVHGGDLIQVGEQQLRIEIG